MAFDIKTLVTDRTQADVDALRSKIQRGLTPEELAEFLKAGDKGAYNYTDLNRVNSACVYLRDELKKYGYTVDVQLPQIEDVIPGETVLPEGYVELSYIESTGTQYIDTGFKPKASTKVKMAFELVRTAAWNCVFGSRNSVDNGQFLFSTTDSGVFGAGYGNQSTNKILFSGIPFSGRHNVEFNGPVITLDGKTVTSTITELSNNYPLFLSCLNNGGSPGDWASIRIYSCQIYDNGKLIRDFTPCRNPSNAVGLYDSVGKKFYGNSGTGSFVEGAEVRQLPTGYTQVEYIESSGTQYIDTGFKANNNTRVVLDGQYLGGSSEQYMYMISAMSTAQSNRYSLMYGVSNGVFSSEMLNDTSVKFTNATKLTDRLHIDKSKNICRLNGETVTNISTAFQSPVSICLFAMHQNTGVSRILKHRIYSCKIYDNGTLVRDYVPCKNKSSVVCLYDLANKKFHQPSGTGSYIGGSNVIGRTPPPQTVLREEWKLGDLPTAKQLNRYLLNVNNVRQAMSVDGSKLPGDMNRLKYESANEIERVLVAVEDTVQRIIRAFFYSGEIFSGEV